MAWLQEKNEKQKSYCVFTTKFHARKLRMKHLTFNHISGMYVPKKQINQHALFYMSFDIPPITLLLHEIEN